jgi:hypothetical protein
MSTETHNIIDLTNKTITPEGYIINFRERGSNNVTCIFGSTRVSTADQWALLLPVKPNSSPTNHVGMSYITTAAHVKG